ncbi:guanine nucleotide exchange factor [Pilobolus umbonatus]|nr:guanine nucleotide exchange factor [Pilobolus umbonatus]
MAKYLSQGNLPDLFQQIENSPSLLTPEEKPGFIQALLTHITTDGWDEELQTKALSALRILGRDPNGSGSLFTKQGMTTLVQIAGLSREHITDTMSSREALKCIANCIYLKEHVKPYLEEVDIIGSASNVLQSADHLSVDTQFLLCRILFFMTVNRYDLVTQLIDSNIASSIQKILMQNIAVIEASKTQSNALITPVTIINEALKLLFNLMLVDSRSLTKEDEENVVTAEKFRDCLMPIFHILVKIPFDTPQPLSPPHSHAIHALMQYPYSVVANVWESHSQDTESLGSIESVADRLIQSLYHAIQYLIPTEDSDQPRQGTASQQVDAILSPLLLVLRAFAEGSEKLRSVMVDSMLPRERDRLQPVHKGFSLPAYLIRLMTSTMLPQTRDVVGETLFVLCDKDVHMFTEEVGYGNGIGYLVNKGIAVDPPKESREDEAEKDINPITGQYLSAEKGPSLADMTDEEKEREAEKLFVLFERLKKTGIIDVENPIAKAMQEGNGRFEEIDTNSDSE